MRGWYRCWALDCALCDRSTIFPTEVQSSVLGVRLIYSKRQIEVQAREDGWAPLEGGGWRCPDHQRHDGDR
jgi:hypothetical protein